ncbi:hypothetical protein RWZ02_10915 [Clostridium butyricum]|uniref:hypothetical protein n=1 Tax=Clostridium butyricum TaxID=1492 RepID=UPI0028FD3641|nr:hypothetical protein [Clostridium butyricum]MDU0323190.1 hypothetical protein [Clostridium butyricum]
MDNNRFINKLIAGTKSSQLKWERVDSKKLSSTYPLFYFQKEDKRLLLEKYTTIEYDSFGEEVKSAKCLLSICDNNFNKLTEIYEDDLRRSGDLWRLYRIVERQVNNVDDIMESFVKDIDDIF